MRLDQNPVFRKVIVPWYDSETVCWVMIVFTGLILLFGFAGVSVARENGLYREYLWIPIVLITMSGGVFVSTAVRLLIRYSRRFSK